MQRPGSDSDLAEARDLMLWAVAAWTALRKHEARPSIRRDPHAHAEAIARKGNFESGLMTALMSKSGSALDGLRRLRRRYRSGQDPEAELRGLAEGGLPMEFTAYPEPGDPLGYDRDVALGTAAEMLAEVLESIYRDDHLPDVDLELDLHLGFIGDAIGSAAPRDEPVTIARLREAIARSMKARTTGEIVGPAGPRHDAMEIVGVFAGVSQRSVERAIERSGPFGVAFEHPPEPEPDPGGSSR